MSTTAAQWIDQRTRVLARAEGITLTPGGDALFAREADALRACRERASAGHDAAVLRRLGPAQEVQADPEPDAAERMRATMRAEASRRSPLAIVRTPDLVSYDSTLTLPIDIHLYAGRIPRAVAVYADSPDVSYESLGDLCDAHALDPEHGLDEARRAELAMRRA